MKFFKWAEFEPGEIERKLRLDGKIVDITLYEDGTISFKLGTDKIPAELKEIEDDLDDELEEKEKPKSKSPKSQYDYDMIEKVLESHKGKRIAAQEELKQKGIDVPYWVLVEADKRLKKKRR